MKHSFTYLASFSLIAEPSARKDRRRLPPSRLGPRRTGTAIRQNVARALRNASDPLVVTVQRQEGLSPRQPIHVRKLFRQEADQSPIGIHQDLEDNIVLT